MSFELTERRTSGRILSSGESRMFVRSRTFSNRTFRFGY